jgi:hypothetical protein
MNEHIDMNKHIVHTFAITAAFEYLYTLASHEHKKQAKDVYDSEMRRYGFPGYDDEKGETE